MSHPVVFDVETQHIFREVGGDVKKLRISVAGIYDYATDSFHAFMENELSGFFALLENASVIVGFNTNHFDLPVLSPYYVGNLMDLPGLDIMESVEHHLGHRLSLDDLVQETLGAKKEGHGLLAVDFFREGKLEELKTYCLSDVRLTRDLYEFGKKNREIFFKNNAGNRQSIPVSWENPASEAKNINLTLSL